MIIGKYTIYDWIHNSRRCILKDTYDIKYHFSINVKESSELVGYYFITFNNNELYLLNHKLYDIDNNFNNYYFKSAEDAKGHVDSLFSKMSKLKAFL
jgi:hypothetical protein